MEDTIYTLVNPEFTFSFGGKEYRLRKATLDKAIQYQAKIKELSVNQDSSNDIKLVAFCIYIMLKDQNSEITEEFVMNNAPADLDIMECMTVLGFINPSKLETIKKAQEAVMTKLTTAVSSS